MNTCTSSSLPETGSSSSSSSSGNIILENNNNNNNHSLNVSVTITEPEFLATTTAAILAAGSSSSSSLRLTEPASSNNNHNHNNHNNNNLAMRMLSKQLDEKDRLEKIKAKSALGVGATTVTLPPRRPVSTVGSSTMDTNPAPVSFSPVTSFTPNTTPNRFQSPPTTTHTSSSSSSNLVELSATATATATSIEMSGFHQPEAELVTDDDDVLVLDDDQEMVLCDSQLVGHVVVEQQQSATGPNNPNDNDNVIDATVTLIVMPEDDSLSEHGDNPADNDFDSGGGGGGGSPPPASILPAPKVVEAHHAQLTDFLQNRTLQLVLGGILCLVVTLAVVVSVSVTLLAPQAQDTSQDIATIPIQPPSSNDLSSQAPSPSLGPTITAPPSSFPTEIITSSPSAQPTAEALILELPEYSLVALQDTQSPQSFAYSWLQGHPGLADMPMWRKQQLFALVSMYYSLDGDVAWTESQKTNYLSYTVTECQWGPAGSPASANSAAVPAGILCTDAGGVRQIFLQHIDGDFITTNNNNNSNNRKGRLPPEIALLTSLQILQVQNCNLKKFYLKNFLPSELGTLPGLAKLELFDNNLKGTIPPLTPWPQLTQLEHLSFDSNVLSGSIPTEIGNMTSLRFLSFSWNSFGGTIPSELGLLSELSLLRFFTNSLVGAVPTELGLLTRLETLEFKYNRLTGGLPEDFCTNMPNLKSIELDCDELYCPSSCFGICRCP